MIYGHKHRACAELPHWALNLKMHYWIVRVEGRNATKRRRHYRAIEKEKLRLVEAGIHFEHVDAVCKYLVSLKQVNAERLSRTLITQPKQMILNFSP